ncbi:hypothetical protein AVEN_43281-1 [Araneus ventricosus]|uniref:Uncharacterized protein n=1 Tax=Araneus ventricosus TaxID=182803 RepID=A0A4Y2GEP7_ARAVE|nr:hypothetical protein AVEN_43281-1 [Araneus ventricosus]
MSVDCAFRGRKLIHFKNIVDRTVEICKEKNLHITAVIVVQHQMNLLSTKNALSRANGSQKNTVDGYDIDVSWNPDLNFWWHEEMAKVSDVCDPVWVDAEHTLFTLYTRYD